MNEPGHRLRRSWRQPMVARDRAETHRTATPLELLFDLCFVVAVAQAAEQLHHGLAAGHVEAAIPAYLSIFFAIWWAWMNFTWFASAYDTDDVPYRVLTLVQIAGVLILAAGVPSAFSGYDFTVVTAGYVVMRAAMLAQWLRVMAEHPEGRATALRYAVGITLLQTAWVLRLWLPEPFGTIGFPVLVLCELSMPLWAERSADRTAWHPEHIVERYGLFTLIVLGESVLAATVAFQAAFVEGGLSAPLLGTALGGLLLLFGLWWLYFDASSTAGPGRSFIAPFIWGYGHFVLFAALAAVGAGLTVVAEALKHPLALDPPGTALTLIGPVALALAIIGMLRWSGSSRRKALLAPPLGVAALLLAATAFAGVIPLWLLTIGAGVAVHVLVALSWKGARTP